MFCPSHNSYHNNWNGILVQPKDSKSLSSAIVRLDEDQAFRKTLGNNGLAKSREALTWDQVGMRFSDTLIKLSGNMSNTYEDSSCA